MGEKSTAMSRGRARTRGLGRAERDARKRAALERARPQWEELTRLEQQVTALLAHNAAAQAAIVQDLRDEGMTATEIAAALETEVGIVRRRMFAVVREESPTTQPLPPSKS